MLISGWFLSGILLLIQSALCSDVQDATSVKENTSQQPHEKIETYRYNHPPLSEPDEEKGQRKERTVDINVSLPQNRTRARGVRRQRIQKNSTPSTLEIPVEVIYETTSSPVKSTTRNVVTRRRLTSNANKKIDIRQTTTATINIHEDNVTESSEVSSTVNNDASPVTEFPKRSRGSYFKKRTEPPAPRVKIVEEKNFVYAHSGNFHYSFLGGDGTKISSQGQLKTYENEKTGEAVSGNVFYKDKDGNDFSLSYTADENGYRPVGAHLPTPPPLPPAIARALKYIADKSTPAPPEKDN